MKLGRREKIVLGIGLPILAVVVLYFLVLAGYVDEYSTLGRVLPGQQQDLGDMRRMAEQHKHTQDLLDHIKQQTEKRGPRFSLYSHLETVRNECGLSDRTSLTLKNVDSRKTRGTPYSISAVTVEMKGVSLSELKDFLYKIYSSDKLLAVERLDIEQGSGKTPGLKVVLEVNTLV
jgi:hypothetical protein